MPVKTADRPLKKIREEVIDQLVVNYGHGEITLEAFEQRLDVAIATEDRETLQDLVADLDLSVDKQYQDSKAETLSRDKNYFDSSRDTLEHEKILRVLSSTNRSGAWIVGKRIKATSILSDFTLDFSNAIIKAPVVRIQLFSVLSSDTIYVPEGARVICNATCILGSISNRARESNDENAPTFIIEGLCVLSSLNIKIWASLKEKWLRFAHKVKNIFS